MRLPGGAFAASIDADSEGHEGRFYVWRHPEIVDLLGPEDAAFFAEIYDVTPTGNFEGASILNRLGHMAPLSPDAEAPLARLRQTLAVERDRRIRPATDDKILTDWNGLLIAALAHAGAALDRPDWIGLATDAYAFINTTMTRSNRLAHAYRDGVSVYPGLATDYAAMTRAALALHAATLDDIWLHHAMGHAAMLRRHHWDAARPGYFLSADDAEALILRPRSATDEATPSANSVMAGNLVRVWRLTGDDTYRADADAIIAAAPFTENLFATTGMLSALDLRLGALDVVIVHAAGQPPDALLAAVREAANPNVVLSIHDDEARLPAGHPASGKRSLAGQPTAYVCRGETCSLPIAEPIALAAALAPTPATSLHG